MDELKTKTENSMLNFNRSVQKLNLYSDRLILAAEKESLNSNQIHPKDEEVVLDATKKAAEFLISYAKFLDKVEEVDKKKTIQSRSPPTYQEFKEQTLNMVDCLGSEVGKLKQFQEYTVKLGSAIKQRQEKESEIDTSNEISVNSFSSF